MKIDPSTNHLDVWAEMEKQVVNGLTKAIGLSNFNSKQIDRVLNAAKVPVSMLQIELHLYFQQKEMVRKQNLQIIYFQSSLLKKCYYNMELL